MTAGATMIVLISLGAYALIAALIYLLDRRIIRAEGGYDLRSLYHYPSTPVCMGLTGVWVPAIPAAVLWWLA